MRSEGSVSSFPGSVTTVVRLTPTLPTHPLAAPLVDAHLGVDMTVQAHRGGLTRRKGSALRALGLTTSLRTLAVAAPTPPRPVAVDPGIVERVPVLAGVSVHPQDVRSHAPQEVLTWCNWFQMGWIHAVVHSAQVIERKISWTHQSEVAQPVGTDLRPVPPKLSVTVTIHGSNPQPAPGLRTLSYLLPESLRKSLVSHSQCHITSIQLPHKGSRGEATP